MTRSRKLIADGQLTAGRLQAIAITGRIAATCHNNGLRITTYITPTNSSWPGTRR